MASLEVEERAAIVRYLRETAELLRPQLEKRGEKFRARHHIDSRTWAADAIERGEHWAELR